MRLEWFEVQGYKNLQISLRLSDLGRVNVLHGDNNVGKSNLLESVGLFFVLIQATREDALGGVSLAEKYARRPSPALGTANGTARTTVRSLGYFTERGFPPDEIWSLQNPQPIRLQAGIRLDPGEIGEGDPPWLGEPFELGFRLERREDELAVSLTRLLRADGIDMATAPADEGAETFLGRVLDLLGPRRRGDVSCPRFARIRADRTIVAEPMPAAAAPPSLTSREPLPRDLGLALYDAEDAADPRFERLLSALGRFKDIVGEGRWRMRYDRREERADLVFEGSAGRVPLRLLGSGVQQIVNLAARLLITGADIVAIEEPELNLRYPAQLRLRDMLSELVGEGQGPSQLLLSSHSPAFEIEEMFYALRRSPAGPVVERRPREQALRFTDPDVTVPPEGARAPLSYVTTDGLVLLPEDVRKDLGLTQGGGVFFAAEKNTGHYRILNEDQFWGLIEPRRSSS